MSARTTGCLLRIYLGESDRSGGRPLYEAIVLMAREAHLAGATVVHGQMGYGAHSRLHTAKILRLSEDLPVIVEIVDEQARIEAFLPKVEAMVTGGLITLEKLEMIARPPSGS